MVAALMAQLVSETVGVLILFLGGMAIYPLSTFVCHSVIGTNRPGKSNRLNRLGLESTAIIFSRPVFSGILDCTVPLVIFSQR